MSNKMMIMLLACLMSMSSYAIARAADEADYFQEPAIKLDSSPGSDEVIPAARAVIPDDAPAWFADKEPRRYRDPWAIITAGPYETLQECELELSSEIKKATDEYINEHLHSKLAATLLNFEGSELKSRFTSGMLRYEQTVETPSFGSMKQIHAKISFGESFVREVEKRWNKIRQTYRLMQVGLVSIVVLSLLGTAFGYFKAESSTRGTRSTNLQFASAAAILVIVVAGVSAARWLLWL